MVCCRVLGIRLLYLTPEGELLEDMEKVIWRHRECDKKQEEVFLGEFRAQKRKDVLAAMARACIPRHEYGDIYFQWWVE